MTGTVIVLAAFAAMEAVSYLTHRFVMHGFGIGLHRSHHRTTSGGFELNDLYPMMFSSIAISAFALGSWGPQVRPLLLVGTGITLYGVAYLFVHEIYIHRRVRLVRGEVRVLEWMKRCHRVHHLYGGEPYGMLLPIVPKELQQRAEGASWDPFLRPSRAGESAGAATGAGVSAG